MTPMNDELEAMVRELRDREEISRLPQLYARGMDRRDCALVRSCFTADAVAFGAWSGPIDDYLPHVRAWIESYPVGATTHFTGNQLIELDGDNARLETYLLTVQWTKDGPAHDEPPGAVSGVRYQDDVVRTGSGWRIARRQVDLDWTTGWSQAVS